MPNRTHELHVDSGKYTFLMFEGDYRIHIYRQGTPWHIVDKGQNAIFSLLAEAIDMKEELEKLQKLSKDAQDCAECADKSVGFESPFAE